MKIKVFCLFLALTFLSTGCFSVIKYQVFETTSKTAPPEGGFFLHKEDALTVAYSFWKNEGIMSFVIYNNSDKPIYIDWYKSSFIYQGNRLPYWEDKVTTTTSGIVTNQKKSNTTVYSGNNFNSFQTSTLGLGSFEGISTIENDKYKGSFYMNQDSTFLCNGTFELYLISNDSFRGNYNLNGKNFDWEGGKIE